MICDRNDGRATTSARSAAYSEVRNPASSDSLLCLDSVLSTPTTSAAYRYSTISELVNGVHEKVVIPSEAKVEELQGLRNNPTSGLS
jgi:hypothetical protein